MTEAPRVAWLRLAGLALMLVAVGVVMIVSGAAAVRSAIDDVAGAGWPGVAAFVLLYAHAAGLSPVRPRPYVAGTALGLIPGALLVAGLGSSARQPTSPAFALSLVVAAAAMAVSAVLARRWTRR
jgi:uncharacterized membrane protein YdjX (TVP38/TMEM64 family)